MILLSLASCTEPEVIANAGLGLSNEIQYGSVLTYTCHTGYEMTSGDSSLLCNITDDYGGEWIGSYPICTSNNIFI